MLCSPSQIMCHWRGRGVCEEGEVQLCYSGIKTQSRITGGALLRKKGHWQAQTRHVKGCVYITNKVCRRGSFWSFLNPYLESYEMHSTVQLESSKSFSFWWNQGESHMQGHLLKLIICSVAPAPRTQHALCSYDCQLG